MRIALVHVSKERNLPLGILYLASYIRKYGGFNDIKIIDEDILQNLRKYKPDIIGFSSFTYDFNATIEIARTIKKEMSVPLIIGGIHFSAIPDLCGVFDIGVIGEGEQTFLELLNDYKEHGEFKNLEKINGIMHKNGITPQRELIKPLESIPFPARDLIDMEKYTSPGGIIKGFVRRGAHMMTSRGCPYRCAFCQSSRYWRLVRWFPPEYVIAEMKELIDKYKVEAISLYDDLFVGDKERLKKIVELIKKEKINEKVMFACQARINLVDEELVTLLKEMNVVQVGFGFESGSERILRQIKSGPVSVEMARNAIKLCKAQGLTVAGNFIVGSPNETSEDVKATLDFIRSNPLDIVNIHLATPLPQTPWWDYATAEHLIPKDLKWEELDMMANKDFEGNIILTKEIDRKELYKLFLELKEEEHKLESKNTNIRFRDVLNFASIKKALKNPHLILKYLPMLFKIKK